MNFRKVSAFLAVFTLTLLVRSHASLAAGLLDGLSCDDILDGEKTQLMVSNAALEQEALRERPGDTVSGGDAARFHDVAKAYVELQELNAFPDLAEDAHLSLAQSISCYLTGRQIRNCIEKTPDTLASWRVLFDSAESSQEEAFAKPTNHRLLARDLGVPKRNLLLVFDSEAFLNDENVVDMRDSSSPVVTLRRVDMITPRFSRTTLAAVRTALSARSSQIQVFRRGMETLDANVVEGKLYESRALLHRVKRSKSSRVRHLFAGRALQLLREADVILDLERKYIEGAMVRLKSGAQIKVGADHALLKLSNDALMRLSLRQASELSYDEARARVDFWLDRKHQINRENRDVVKNLLERLPSRSHQ